MSQFRKTKPGFESLPRDKALLDMGGFHSHGGSPKWLVYNGKIMENPIKTIIHIIDGGKVMPTRSPSGHQVVTKWSPHSNCQRSGYLPSGKIT
jgi:hypothetical protein